MRREASCWRPSTHGRRSARRWPPRRRRAYFGLLAADALVDLLRETLKSRDATVALQTDLHDAGIIGDYDLQRAQAERAAVAADVAVAERADANLESALAALLGRSPREVFAPKVGRDVVQARLVAVPGVPEGLPSDMLERRPDVRQAEAELAAASLRIDAARAQYFPNLALTASYGSESAALSNLFSGPAAGMGHRSIAAAAADRGQGDRGERAG